MLPCCSRLQLPLFVDIREIILCTSLAGKSVSVYVVRKLSVKGLHLKLLVVPVQYVHEAEIGTLSAFRCIPGSSVC